MGTKPVEPGRPLDLAREVIGIGRTDRLACVVEQVPGRPPQRIDGLTIGAPMITSDPPHDGEMHPDGDELLFVLSGSFAVTLELPAGDEHLVLGPDDALVVPRGVWHKVLMREPGRLLHITPGPQGDARLPST